MSNVTIYDGIRYGLHLIGYQLFVFLVGGLGIGIGVGVSRTNPLLAAIVVLSGLAVIYAGGMVILYKVIRDAVSAGTWDSAAVLESNSNR